MGYVIDVNQFSLQSFYRNRLVRCYLRAIRLDGSSKENPIHGFDPADDFPLAKLTAFPAEAETEKEREEKKKGKKQTEGEKEEKPYHGPYLLINTALNITDPTQLRWQERKAAAFVFASRYCGSNLTGYRETR